MYIQEGRVNKILFNLIKLIVNEILCNFVEII